MRRLLLLAHVPDEVDSIGDAMPYLETGYLVAMHRIEGREFDVARADLEMAFRTLVEVLPAQYGGPQ